MIYNTNIPVIELSGSPRQRGRIHGESLRSAIKDMIARHRQFLGESFTVNTELYVNLFDKYASFEPAIKRFAPHLIEEVEGIAEGAGLDRKAVFHLQLMDEDWTYGFYQLSADLLNQKCTGFAAINDSQAYAGQNLDLPAYLDGAQVLLKILHEDSDLTSYVFSYAGLIGLTGMNNAPLGVCCNTLSQLTPCQDGLPVAFVIRRLLECRSFQEAMKFIRTAKHASGQNYILSTPEKIASFECSANAVVELVDNHSESYICHTNHPITNGDQREYDLLLKSLPPEKRPDPTDSIKRYESIGNRIGKASRTLSLSEIKAALSAHDDPANPVSIIRPESDNGADWFTFGSVIYDYGSRPRLHLAPGPPCSTNYRTFSF